MRGLSIDLVRDLVKFASVAEKMEFKATKLRGGGEGMKRPEFDDIKDYEEFCKYYWYRDELIKICKAHGLKAPSGKIELYMVIEAYFRGEKILPGGKHAGERVGKSAGEKVGKSAGERGGKSAGEKVRKSAGERVGNGAGKHAKDIVTENTGVGDRQHKSKMSKVMELTLETGLIECGFTFGPRFREFFVKQTGEEKFKFNVDMVATAKKVKETGDDSFTLGDLLDVYYGKQTYATYDKSALQWNRFVHDFCADEATKGFKNRLKAAAALWKIVRDSDREKKYSRALLEEFRKVL